MTPRCFFRIGSALPLMVSASSCDFLDLLVISTTRVNIFSLLSFGWRVKEPAAGAAAEGLFVLQNIKLLLPFVGVKCRNVVQLAIQAVFRGGGAKCRAKDCFEKR
jgi:hypothetical protein